jgi:sigma-B regulation protein RsbU (phosphoserine phosphatase)
LFEARSGWFALALGDVCGKGLGPALVAAGLRALVRSRLAQRGANLAGLVREVNAYLLASLPEDTFITLFLAVLEPAGGQLRYVNAGHPGPLVLAGTAGVDPVRLTAGGPMLGVCAGAEFQEGRARLEPDSLLAVFSDGLTEAMGPEGTIFRQDRVLKALRAGRGGPAALALAGLLREVEGFCGQRGPADDVSVILLRRLG